MTLYIEWMPGEVIDPPLRVKHYLYHVDNIIRIFREYNFVLWPARPPPYYAFRIPIYN